MKNRGVCRKCKSRDIIRVDSSEGGSGVIFLSYGGLESIALTRFLCGSCGFTEEWLDNEEWLEKVKKRYKSRFRTEPPEGVIVDKKSRWQKLRD